MPSKINEHVKNLSTDSQEYIESLIAYYKLDAFKKSAKAISALLRFIAFLAIFLLFFTFLMIGVSLFLGDILDSTYLGFLCVAGFNFILLIYILTIGKKLIDKIVLRFLSEIFSDVNLKEE